MSSPPKPVDDDTVDTLDVAQKPALAKPQPIQTASVSFKKRSRSAASRTKKRARHTFDDAPLDGGKQLNPASNPGCNPTLSDNSSTHLLHHPAESRNRIRQTFSTHPNAVALLDRTGATAHRLDVVATTGNTTANAARSTDAPPPPTVSVGSDRLVQHTSVTGANKNAASSTAAAPATTAAGSSSTTAAFGSASTPPHQSTKSIGDAVAAFSSVTHPRRKPFGPMRAPAHLRASVRVDYQPDVCKDYKETGYCGFGDACKFLHDRSDYKAGWQLDRDWATREQERRQRLLRGQVVTDQPSGTQSSSANPDVDDDLLPFACFICRGDFSQPVMTLCGHYFCESCALGRMQKQGCCAVCGKQMGGTFNAAPKLVAKLKRKRENDRENDVTEMAWH